MAATWDSPKASPTLQYCGVPQTYVNPSEDNAGFTKKIKSHDTKVFYLDPLNPAASDSVFNTGEDPNTPLATVAAAMSRLREGFADHLVINGAADYSLDAGFTDCPNGRSPSEPIVIYSSGSDRPKVNIFDWAATGNPNRQNIHVIGMRFYLERTQPATVVANIEADTPFPGSTYDTADSKGSMRAYEGFGSLVLEDNIFDHVETLFKGVDTANPGDGLRLRRNIYTGAYVASSNIESDTRPSNLYMESCSYVDIEENVFDFGGWYPTVKAWRGGSDTGDAPNDYLAAAADSRNHNIYQQYNCYGDTISVINNIIARGSSHGVQMRGGGVCDNNFFGRNAIGAYMNDTTLVGSAQIPNYSPRMELTNNWVSEGSSQYKPVDALYQHDKRTGAVWGLEYHAYREIVRNLLHSNNIVSNLDPNDTFVTTRTLRAFEYQNPQGGSAAPMQETDAYHWDNPTQGDGEGYTDPVRTLGTYYQKLVTDGDLTGSEPGDDDFDKFMGVVKTRNKGEWDSKFAAPAINDYGRTGLNATTYSR